MNTNLGGYFFNAEKCLELYEQVKYNEDDERGFFMGNQ